MITVKSRGVIANSQPRSPASFLQRVWGSECSPLYLISTFALVYVSRWALESNHLSLSFLHFPPHSLDKPHSHVSKAPKWCAWQTNKNSYLYVSSSLFYPYSTPMTNFVRTFQIPVTYTCPSTLFYLCPTPLTCFIRTFQILVTYTCPSSLFHPCPTPLTNFIHTFQIQVPSPLRPPPPHLNGTKQNSVYCFLRKRAFS